MPFRILRPQSHEVCRKLNFAVVHVHFIKIDDSPVVWICNGNRKKDAAGNSFEGANIAKSLAIRHRLSRVNLNMDYVRIQRLDGQYRKK